MSVACNEISLNEAALMSALQDQAKAALELEGQALQNIMAQEVGRTTHGDAPGKPEWRQEIVSGLKRVCTQTDGSGILMTFGFDPSGQPETVRAMIVEEGSGSAVGGEPIHAGPRGRSVWDGDVTGRHPSRARSEYKLPGAFNQKGNRFVTNAVRRMQSQFGERVEQMFSYTPDGVYYGNVSVRKR